MSRRLSKAVLCAGGAVALALGGALPGVGQECDPNASNYLFILLDTSSSMSWAPRCEQYYFDYGECAPLCNSPECRVPTQADSPNSKLFHIKSKLYEALSSPAAENLLFGFATFNQDTLRAGSKHWLYEATGNGVTIPGWGPFPAAGSQEVLGSTWSCDQGSGDDEAGCAPSTPADLSDAWEVERVRNLPKGGASFNQSVTFFVRKQNPLAVYRVQYTPVAGGVLGAPLSLQVRVDRCGNASCSSRIFLGDPVVAFAPVSEYLSWQNGASRAAPVGYFPGSVADVQANYNSCAGWDPNTDDPQDVFNGYSLRWPTISDLRGSLLDSGDVLPLDWQSDHRQDIRNRLAPNLALDPLATPDFRVSPYFEDSRIGADTFLRLKNEEARPLLPSGATPLGSSLEAFRTWYADWAVQAAAEDLDFACRARELLLITDGEETCGGDPCTVAADLYNQYGVRVWVVAHGVDSQNSPTVMCTAINGGTYAYYPITPYGLLYSIDQIFGIVGQQ